MIRPSDAKKRSSSRLIPYAVLLLSLLSTVAVYFFVGSYAESRDRARFDNVATEIRNNIESRLHSYISLLRNAHAHIETRPGIPRREDFDAYAAAINLMANYPGIQGLGFTAHFPAAKRAEIVAFGRSQGFADFNVWPDTAADWEHSILHLYPLDERNRAAIGFNMYSEPVRRTAMQRAAETERAALSSKVILVQEIDEQKQAGFLIYFPVFSMPPRTPEEHTTFLRGFVYAPFRADDFFSSIPAVDSANHASIAVYDGETVDPAALLHDEKRFDRSIEQEVPSRFENIERIRIAGNTWTLVVKSRPSFNAVSSRDVASVLLGLGVLISFVLFGLSRSQSKAWATATATAERLSISEAEAHESDLRLRTFMNANIVGICVKDIAGTIYEANDEYLRITGFSRSQLERGELNWRKITPPSFVPEDERAMRHAAEQGNFDPFEKEYVRPDGSRVPIIIGGASIPGSGGKIFAFVLDLSARKKMEEALRQREHELDSLIRNTPDVIARFDRELRYVYISPMVETYSGRTSDQYVGKHILEAPGPLETSEAFALKMREVFNTGESKTVQFAYQGIDGKQHFYQARLVPERDASGNLTTVLSVTRDVTELKEAENRFIRSAERSHLLADASKAFVAARLDVQGIVKIAVEKALGPLGDAAGLTLLTDEARRLVKTFGALQRVSDFQFPPELYAERPMSPLEEMVVAKGEPIFSPRVDLNWLRERLPADQWAYLQGTPVGVMVAPVRISGRTVGCFGVLRYTPDSLYAKEDLLTLQELADRVGLSIENSRLYSEAREAIQLRDEFLSIASHELKTPLTPLKLQVQSLERLLSKHPDGALPADKLTKVAGVTNRQVERITGLVNNLLDISRISAGKLDLEPENVDLTSMVRDTVERFQLEAHRTGSRITIDAPEHLEGYWDPLRLEQVITNLVSNAIKYGEGKPIDVRVCKSPEFAEIMVRDHGIGMSQEFANRAFERFSRGVSGRSYAGLGLGLYIVKQIVDGHGGEISIKTAPGEGSEFKVIIPINPTYDRRAEQAAVQG